MKILRTFSRLTQESDPDEWAVRMDGLLAADPRELLEFVSDAVIALSVTGALDREGRVGIPAVLDGLALTLEVSDPVVPLARRRFADIVSALGEHAPEREVHAHLAAIARDAPWE